MTRARWAFIVALGALCTLIGVAPATATHATSVTVDQASVVIPAGATATATGEVNAECGPGFGNAYGWTIEASGAPAGTTATFDPASSPGGPGNDLTSFTLDLDVPDGTPAGTYPIDVTVTFDDDLNNCGFNAGDTRTDTFDLIVLAGDCPKGGDWSLQQVGDGDIFDANGDGFICTKLVQGKGNSANSQRGGGQTGTHADGHNHKDNNN